MRVNVALKHIYTLNIRRFPWRLVLSQMYLQKQLFGGFRERLTKADNKHTSMTFLIIHLILFRHTRTFNLMPFIYAFN